jgi:hypothetical protein
MLVMRDVRLPLALAFCAPFLPAEAQVFRIPQDGSPMPNYWFGTNCRASASVDMFTSEGTPIEPIDKAQLLLNGQQVYYWQAANPGQVQWSKAVKVMFDSSHFAHGTTVEVTFRVWGASTGTMYETRSNPDPVVKNEFMMYRDPTPPEPDPQPTVLGFMQSKNYIIWMEGGSSWDSSDYFMEMYDANVVHFSGHGLPMWHSAPVGTGIVHTAYLTERELDTGTGLPPFNSTDCPSVNFIHLQACNCGDTSNFKSALYPYYMGWGGQYLENQALLAYTCYTRVADRIKNAHLVWERLSQGWTIRAVWDRIKNEYLPGNAYGIEMSDNGDGDFREMLIEDLSLICGPDNGAMRLKTVYTGDHAPPMSKTTPWFWVLTEIGEG